MGLKHQARFTDINGDSWFVLIYDEDYGGATIFEFVLGPTGFELTWEGDVNDRSVAIIPSRCSIPMMVQNGNDETLIDNLATGYEGRYFVEIYYEDPASPVLAAAHLFWRGILLADLTEFEDAYYPQEVQLTAVDDLANLKNVPYSFSPEATGYGKLRGHIANALNKLRPWTITADTHRYTFADYLRVKYDATNYTSPILNGELNYNRFKDNESNPPKYTSTYDVLHDILSGMGARIYWHAGVDDDSGFIVDSVPAHEHDNDLLTGYTVNSSGTATATTVTRENIDLPSTDYQRAAGWMRGYLNPLQRVERQFEYGGAGPFVVDHLYEYVDADNYLDGTDVTIFTAATIHYQEGTPLSLRFKLRAQNTSTSGLYVARLKVTVKLNLGQYYARRAATHIGSTQYYVPSGNYVALATYSEGSASWSTTSSHRLEFISPAVVVEQDNDLTFDFGIDMPGLPADLTSEDCIMDFVSVLVAADGSEITAGLVHDIYQDGMQEVREVYIFPTNVYDIDGAQVTFIAENDEASANEVLELPDVGFSDLIGNKGGGLTVEVGGTRMQPSAFHSLAATGTDLSLHSLTAREWLLGQSRNIRKQRGTVYDIGDAPTFLPSFLHTYEVSTVKYALYTMTFRAALREWDVEMLELARAGSVTVPPNGFSGALPEVPGLPPVYTTGFNNAEVNDENHNDSGDVFAMFITG
jgi:hypothetical protein